MTNPDELQRKFGAWPAHRWILALVVLILLAVAGIPWIPSAWQGFKLWRADHFLADAERLLAEQQISLAFERARSALQLVPNRPEALRMNARLLAMIGSESSLSLWQRLLESGAATAGDQASYLETGLKLDRPDAIAGLVTSLDAGSPSSERISRLLALYHLHTRRPAEAIRHAEDAHRLAPLSATNTLLLAALLDGSTNSPPHARARDLFWSVARTNGPLQIEALQQLVNGPNALRDDREQAFQLLSQRAHRTTAEEVLLAEAQMQLHPQREGEIASNLVSQVRREDWDQLTLIVEALERRNRHGEVLSLTAVGRHMVNRRLFLARHAALLATGQAEAAYRESLHTGAPLRPFELALLRMSGAQEAEEIKRRDEHLRELLEIAGDNPRRLRQVADLAEAGKTREAVAVAADAWKRLSRQTDEAPEALRHLQRLADRRGDTWTARDFARRAYRLDDRQPGLRLEMAYYDLLLGEDVEGALAEAEGQLNSGTNQFFARAVAALGYLRSGAPERARAILDRFVVTDARGRSDALAVVVATYGANGLETRARELAGTVPLASLRPEERELIRPWLLPPPRLGGEAPSAPN